MSLDDKRWRSMQELDEYSLALDKGRGQTPSGSPAKLRNSGPDGDDDDDKGNDILNV